MSKKLATEEFIWAAKEKHGNLYDYSQSNYEGASKKVQILCKKHGPFFMAPTNHTHKSKPQGCPACASKKRAERLNAINEARIGTSTLRELDTSAFAANVLADLGMLQRGSRKVRHVLLECTHCSQGFEISADNAKRRKEHLCATCKTIVTKTCICGTQYETTKTDMSLTVRLQTMCPTCIVLQDQEEMLFKKEGFTLKQVLKLCSLEDDAIVLKRSGRILYNGIGYESIKLYGHKTSAARVMFMLAHKREPAGLVYKIDKTAPVSPSNITNECQNLPPRNNMTRKAFIEKSTAIHGGFYSYENTVFVDRHKKVKITCPKHGEFDQAPYSHLTAHGCQSCARETRGQKRRLTQEEFIARAYEKHGDKYDYAQSVYMTTDTKVTILCKQCGSVFEQTPDKHINEGCGCPACRNGGFDGTKQAILYFCKLLDVDVYKIGVTNRTVSERYSKADFEKFETVKWVSFELGSEAYSLEQALLEDFSNCRYEGPKLLETGNTELLTIDIWDVINGNTRRE